MTPGAHATVGVVPPFSTKRRLDFRPPWPEFIVAAVVAMIPSVAIGIFSKQVGMILLTLPFTVCFVTYFFCPSISVDRERDEVRVRGFLYASFQTCELHRIDSVTLRQPVSHLAPYALHLEGSAAPVDIPYRSTNYLDTRRRAEQVASLLGIDILDMALGRIIRRRRAPGSTPPVDDDAESRDLSLFAEGIDDDPDVLPIRREIHFTTRVMVLLPRIAAVYVALCLVPAVQKPLRPHLKALSSLLVVGAAATYLFKRSGVVLNRSAQLVRSWRIHPVRPFYSCRSLTRYLAVALVREIVPSMTHSLAPRYSVLLEGTGTPLLIQQTREREKAHTTAEEVADFLGLSLVDLSQAESSDPALRRRMLSRKIYPGGRSRALEPMPKSSRLAIERRGDAVEFLVPRGRLDGQGYVTIILFGIVPAVCTLLLLIQIVRQAGGGMRFDPGGLVCTLPFFLLHGLSGWWLVLPSFRMARRVERIIVSRERIRVEVDGHKVPWIAEVRVDEIKDVLVQNGKSKQLSRELRGNSHSEVVSVDGDSTSVEFGIGLTHDERVWLRDAVAAIVSASLSADDPDEEFTGREEAGSPSAARGDVLSEFRSECFSSRALRIPSEPVPG